MDRVGFSYVRTADQLAFIRVRGTHTKVGENCMHCKSRHVYAETEIVSLVSSFVIVLTLSESFVKKLLFLSERNAKSSVLL